MNEWGGSDCGWGGIDEILDIESNTHIAIKWIWFGKTLNDGSSVLLFFEKCSFYRFYFILLFNMQMKEIRKSKTYIITCSWEMEIFYSQCEDES